MRKIMFSICFILCLGMNSFAGNDISIKEVEKAQKEWGDAIVAIGNAYQNGEDYRALAAEIIDKYYAYDSCGVLFKPTKAFINPFRPTKDEALSYFVKGVTAEDKGFALQPWSKVRFADNECINTSNDAICMGNYYFTDAVTGEESKVEYSFGYKKNAQGRLVIFLHHSSFPFNPK